MKKISDLVKLILSDIHLIKRYPHLDCDFIHCLIERYDIQDFGQNGRLEFRRRINEESAPLPADRREYDYISSFVESDYWVRKLLKYSLWDDFDNLIGRARKRMGVPIINFQGDQDDQVERLRFLNMLGENASAFLKKNEAIVQVFSNIGFPKKSLLLVMYLIFGLKDTAVNYGNIVTKQKYCNFDILHKVDDCLISHEQGKQVVLESIDSAILVSINAPFAHSTDLESYIKENIGIIRKLFLDKFRDNYSDKEVVFKHWLVCRLRKDGYTYKEIVAIMKKDYDEDVRSGSVGKILKEMRNEVGVLKKRHKLINKYLT